MIPGSINNTLISGDEGGYAISRSVRLNSADSAFFSRTPASAGNRKTWTWAGWVKRSKLGSVQRIFAGWNGSSTSDNDYTGLLFGSDDTIRVGGYSVFFRTSNAVFRDISAWMHVVFIADLDNASNALKFRVWVNSTELAWTSTGSNPSTTGINAAVSHTIGSEATGGGSFCDLYLADIHFIDGQALDPTSFGEFSATTGVWMPKRYTGTYGTNGFKLNFSDNSTAAALGTDTSGNGNTWSVNNLSVTAGAGNDSLVDVPTNGSEVDTGLGAQVRGNYCTLNPLANGGSTLSNGNLDVTTAISSGSPVVGTFGMSVGKWYWEITKTAYTTEETAQIGIVSTRYTVSSSSAGASSFAWIYEGYNGNKETGGSASSYGSAYVVGDIIGVAFDADAGTLQFYKNNVSQGVAFTGLTSGPYMPVLGDSSGGGNASFSANFGQRQFAYTSPAGFKALCTANLPAPTITQPSTVMDVKLYTGNGTTNTITGLNFSPDLVWCKVRDVDSSHNLWDTVRGARIQLQSNTTNAEYTESAGYGLTAFNSDGFTLGLDNQGPGRVNSSGNPFAAWCWDAGSSTVTNTQGSISSQVRANASAGFSICTMTTQSTGSGTYGHGLNVAPSLVIVKIRGGSSNWTVYHKDIGATKFLSLNLTSATTTSSLAWNDTAPTSTLVTLGAAFDSSVSIVTYNFAPVVGYSSISSFVGNGSTDGPFVYTGFRPRWVMFKNASAGGNDWKIFDAARDAKNVVTQVLYPNLSNAEDANTGLDFTSNGFKVRDSGSAFNGSTNTIIYAAFAESPFQCARAR